MYHKVKQPDETIYYDIYHIFSVYLDRKEFDSKRKVVHYIAEQTFKSVLDEDDTVVMLSKVPHMLRNKELERKTVMYAQNKDVKFINVRKVNQGAVRLAIDAIMRRTTIIEKLR
ncbi:hypothetical protein CN514_07865 [Bacillus sp. AFS001701]|nr:hypothetical protein CN514_07865 [Bacillus sp. AFS001701]